MSAVHERFIMLGPQFSEEVRVQNTREVRKKSLKVRTEKKKRIVVNDSVI